MTTLPTLVTYDECQTGHAVAPPDITLGYPPLDDLVLPYDALLDLQIPFSMTPLIITALTACVLFFVVRIAIANRGLRNLASVGVFLVAVMVAMDFLAGWAIVRFHPQLIARIQMDPALKVVSAVADFYGAHRDAPSRYLRRHGRHWASELEHLHDRMTAQAILHALEQQQTDVALQYAVPVESRPVLRPFVSRAYIHGSVDQMGLGASAKALALAKQANGIWFDRHSEENLNRVAALFAIEQAQTPHFQNAIDLVQDISPRWQHPQSQQLIGYLERQQFLQLFKSDIS